MKQSQSRIDRLIGRLADPSKQDKAFEELVAIGPAAVKQLIEALDHAEAIVMGPLFILKRRGVSGVAAMFEGGSLKKRIGEVLVKITGEDHGEDINKWRAWWADHKREEPYVGYMLERFRFMALLNDVVFASATLWAFAFFSLRTAVFYAIGLFCFFGGAFALQAARTGARRPLLFFLFWWLPLTPKLDAWLIRKSV